MILAINTSTLQFSLALLETDGSVMAEYAMSEAGGHFGRLMPALDFLLESVGSDIHRVEGIAVARGPGSFTGLRVGLAAAKGLSHGLDAPVVGVSSLEALAAQFSCPALPVTAILDSRKGEVFMARFSWKGNPGDGLVRDMADQSLKIASFSRECGTPTLIVGNDYRRQASLLKAVAGPCAHLAPPHCWSLKASLVGGIGLARLRAGDVDEPAGLSPIYLRPADIRNGSRQPGKTSERGH